MAEEPSEQNLLPVHQSSDGNDDMESIPDMQRVTPSLI